MRKTSINLNDLLFLVADASPSVSTIVVSMLRGFGVGNNKVIEARTSIGAMKTLSSQKIDILLCDAGLPPHGGLRLTHAIRHNAKNENRTVPILLMTTDTREITIKNARDAGANMVIEKPMSPASLYDRLTWIALNKRPFIDTATYFGPDRRFKIEGYPAGVGRRKGDNVEAVAEESGPALGQNDIDSLFSAARTGKE